MELSKIRSLIPEFKSGFLDKPKGRDHVAWFPAGRTIGRNNLAEATRRTEAGEDVTEFVLSKLLPHLDSPYNRERGAWCCIANVITRDIRQWFEGIGWAKPDDWPQVAQLVLRFVQSVTADPTRLAAECEAFRASPYSKGFQSGFLSPILNAVRPADFSLVNSKTKRALKSLTGLTCRTRLVHYPASNALVRSIVKELGAELPSAGLDDVLPGDVFDLFCHWWVSVYEGDVGSEGEEVANPHADTVTDGMARYFHEETERKRLCQLMATHIELAHAQGASCWEITVRKRRIRLNVGRLAALEFTKDQLRLGLVPEDLSDDLRDQLQKEGRWSAEFATKPVTRLCAFEPRRYWELESGLAPSVKEYVRIAAQTGLQTPFHRFHAPAMLDYLEQVLERKLPRPIYQTTSVAKTSAPTEHKTLMEPATRFDSRQSLFHKVDYTVGHLASSIELGDIGLPELQRPFVWDRSKVRDLFDSMFRGFPVGFLLLWSNAQMQPGKQIGIETKQLKAPGHLVVDGQQRLTSLYAVFKSATVLKSDFTPTRIEIAFRPRDGRFEVADAAVQRDPEFIPSISILWSTRGGEHRFVGAFINKLKQTKETRPEDEDVISDNISRLQNLINYQLTALVIQPDVQEDDVADIFVRINNQGVKLDQADFILTLLSVFWPEGRKQLEDFSRAAKQPPTMDARLSPFNYLIQPGPDQMLRASIGLGFLRGRMKAVYQILRGRDSETGQFLPELRDAQFARLKDAQPKVLDLNDWHAYLQALRSAGFVGPETISSENSVIYTYVLYLLAKHQSGVDEPILSRLIRRWFVTVTLSARYSGSSESTMDGDLGDLKEAKSPAAFLASLERKIETTLTPDFWSISLPEALETSAALAPQLLAFRAAQVVLSAPVLFSDKKVRDLLDPAIRPPTKSVEQHHLFPRAWLKRQGITTSKRINQVANLTLLEWPKNRDLSDLPPSEYFPRLRKEFAAGQWEHMHHLHALPPGWESMEYEHFLEQRRKMMAQVIRQAFQALSPSDDHAGVILADASLEERQVWPLVQTVEQRLRAIVRGKYDAEWGVRADGQIAATLGKDALAAIEKTRSKHLAVYERAIDPATADVLDYCYLGQLGQLMSSNAAWTLFQSAFRDKRELDDLLKRIIPVRNDLAHFRRVPAKELDRCRLAADDLLVATAKL
jgi:hypothetical protein